MATLRSAFLADHDHTSSNLSLQRPVLRADFGKSMNPVVIAVVAGVSLLVISVLMDRILIPFRARRRVEKLLKSKTQHDPRSLENPKYGTLLDATDFLRITSGKRDSSELRWAEVEEVHAYKRDLFTTDLICLAFKKLGKEEYYEIHEEMAGYHDLLDTLPRHLPKFTMEWFVSVAVPAFEANHRVIWKRSLSNPDDAANKS
jgi:hypothetical protein